jgi:hypothetical protein
MVAMTALYGTGIRYTRLLVHLVSDNLLVALRRAGNRMVATLMEGWIFFCLCAKSLVLEDSNKLKSSMATT